VTIDPGDRAVRRFVVTPRDMELFQQLSGDRSRIHVDPEYARGRGYRDKIVYGGIMLAQLSKLLGSEIPGDLGVSAHWSIDYRSALYVGEEAELALEVQHVSPATGLLQSVYVIRTEDRVIATGKVQSKFALQPQP
jgi:acyl dehydratase